MASPYLSIVIPAYNEALRIGKALEEVRKYVASAPFETELLLVDDLTRELILQRADASALRQKAIGQGMQTLAGDGWHKVAQGLTTVQEVLRVTQE